MILPEHQTLLPALLAIAAALICFVFGRVAAPAVWGPWSLFALAAAGACLVPVSRLEFLESQPPPAAADKTMTSSSDEVDAAATTYPGEAREQFMGEHAVDLVWDRLSIAIAWGAAAAGFLIVLTGLAALRTNRRAAMFYGILLLSIAGTLLVGMANDLIALFLAVELSCLPVSGLVWISRTSATSREAGLKYGLMSAASSSLLLLGFCLLSGLAGSTNLADVHLALVSRETPAEPQLFAESVSALGVASMVLIFAGLGFRLAIVPFHFGLSEVFAGTTPDVAALLAVIPRVAAVAALLRVVVVAMARLEETGVLLTLVLAGITMVVASALVLRQTRFRSILFYIVLAQSGFMLSAIAVAFRDMAHVTGNSADETMACGGLSAAMFALASDLLAMIGLFALVTYLSQPDGEVQFPEQLSGLLKSRPLAALCASALLLSLVGLPPFCGFWGRLRVLMSLLSMGNESTGAGESGPNVAFWILTLAAVCQVLATAAVCAQLLVRMCLDAEVARPRPGGGIGALAVVVMTAAISLGCGLFPQPAWRYFDELQTTLRDYRSVGRDTPGSGSSDGAKRKTTAQSHGLNSLTRFETIQQVGPQE
jgi:NADH-quinone oxidoreductase subunit N